LGNKEYIEVKLPKNTVDKIKRIVEEHDGLFEDEEDYITHCIIDYNLRSNRL
jgi:hypothetical protein